MRKGRMHIWEYTIYTSITSIHPKKKRSFFIKPLSQSEWERDPSVVVILQLYVFTTNTNNYMSLPKLIMMKLSSSHLSLSIFYFFRESVSREIREILPTISFFFLKFFVKTFRWAAAAPSFFQKNYNAIICSKKFRYIQLTNINGSLLRLQSKRDGKRKIE